MAEDISVFMSRVAFIGWCGSGRADGFKIRHMLEDTGHLSTGEMLKLVSMAVQAVMWTIESDLNHMINPNTYILLDTPDKENDCPNSQTAASLIAAACRSDDIAFGDIINQIEKFGHNDLADLINHLVGFPAMLKNAEVKVEVM
jgi:hypothetical protein